MEQTQIKQSKERLIGLNTVIDVIIEEIKKFADHMKQNAPVDIEKEFWVDISSDIDAERYDKVLNKIFDLNITAVNDNISIPISTKLGIVKKWKDLGVLDKFLRQSVQQYLQSKCYYLYQRNLLQPAQKTHGFTLDRHAGILNYLFQALDNEGVLKIPPHAKGGWQAALRQLVPTHIVKSRTINDWKDKNIQTISQEQLLTDIAEALDTTYDHLWGNSNLTHGDLDKLAKLYAIKQRFKSGESITTRLHKLSSGTGTLTSTETALLSGLKSATDIPRTFISTIKPYFDSHTPSHSFIDELFLFLFETGYYDIIYQFLLPRIHHRADLPFLLAKAHLLGSLKHFEEAALCLQDLQKFVSVSDDIADIRTSAVSNLLRQKLADDLYYISTLNTPNLPPSYTTSPSAVKLKSIFDVTLNQYKDIFDSCYHYYPGINYAYMVSLYEAIFNTPEKAKSRIGKIALDSKPSIEEAPKDDYWAHITKFEFQALKKKFHSKKFDIMLTTTKPTKDQLLRSLRQVNFYIDTLEAFGKGATIEKSVKDLESEIRKRL